MRSEGSKGPSGQNVPERRKEREAMPEKMTEYIEKKGRMDFNSLVIEK